MPKRTPLPPDPVESQLKEAKADMTVLLKMAETVVVQMQKQQRTSRAIADILDIRSRVFDLILAGVGLSLLASAGALLAVIFKS